MIRVDLDGNRPRRPEAADAGVAAIEGVILYPLVILLVFLVVQGVLYFHAQNIAQSVANSAVQRVRIENGSIREGHDEADRRLDAAGRAFAATEVSIARDRQTASVTVSGQAPSIIPGVRGLRVSRTATGPVERLTDSGSP